MLDPFQDEGWDALVITDLDGNLVKAPGLVVDIDGGERKIGWDIKGASGQDGASSERKGQPIGQFATIHELTDDPVEGSDFAEWDSFVAILKQSYEADPPVALTVYNPSLAMNGHTAASVEEIGRIKVDARGLGRVKVKWVEYRPPKPRGGGGAGGGAGGGGKGGGFDKEQSDDDSQSISDADEKIRDRLKTIDDLQDEGAKL
jgi:hypothetical protein